MIYKEKPHLIALCEVKPKNGQRKILEYEINDYKISNRINIKNNHGRGIVILSHSSISPMVMDVECPVNCEEACLVEIRLTGDEKLAFACMYRSPTSKESSADNNDKINALIRSIASNKKYSHKCFVGDFNLGTINWRNWTTPHNEDSKEEKFLEALRDSYLHQHVKELTRCRGNDEPSTIDLILTGDEHQITELQYLNPLGKSDHSVLTFNFNCSTETKKLTQRYIYGKADYLAMKQHLESYNWTQSFIAEAPDQTVDELWQKFKGELLQLRNRFVPLQKIGKPSWRSKGKIPISRELQIQINEKRRLHRKWIRSPPSKRNENRSKYIKARNKVNRMMTQANRSYEQDICSRSKNNPKIFWSHVRSKLKSSSGVNPLLERPDDKSSLKYDDFEKANILQRQFCSVFTTEPIGNIPHFEQRTDKVLDKPTITSEMVRKKVEKLDPSKSFGPDEIHPQMLKELAAYISEPLALIMNKTLDEGYLPDEWKLANVTPIYKNKGAQNLAVNYRPVSLTSIVCKLMESFLRSHIMSHLMSEDLLSNRQYGFIEKRSTVTQLLHYLDKCCESISEGNVVDSIYFDFEKAFDTVPHRRLLKKLQCYGIKGAVLDWITDFLKDRKQTVRVNGAESFLQNVISGIPQGSVLGPLLFVVYINDLPDEVMSDIFLFADDTKIFKEVTSVHDSLIIQADIDTLEQWSQKWLLRFHPDKCHVLTLGKFSNIVHAHGYALNGKELEHVFVEKDLGVLVDAELTFADHISEKVNKANSMLGVIKRSFACLSPSTLRVLYTTFVRPHLEFAQSVWSPRLRKYVNLLEGVQRRATRLVDNFRNLPYQERLRRLDLPSLEFRRIFGDMVQVYKHIHIYDPSTIPDKIIRRTRPARKHNFEMIPNFTRDGVRGVQRKSFYYRCLPTWNRLPKNVVDAKSVKVFKERLNDAWKNHPLRYDY